MHMQCVVCIVENIVNVVQRMEPKNLTRLQILVCFHQTTIPFVV